MRVKKTRLLLSIFIVLLGATGCQKKATYEEIREYCNEEQAPLQLEECNKGIQEVKGMFHTQIWHQWISEGKTIKAYDVSEKEQIAIAFSDSTIGVFTKDMDFLYELAFETSGAYGVYWNGENMMMVDIRSEIAAEFDNSGKMIKTYHVNNLGKNVSLLENRVREAGENLYFSTNPTRDDPLGIYSYYTILKRYDKYGQETIIYQSSKKVDGVMFCVFVLLGILVFSVMVDIMVAVFIIKKKNKQW